MTFFRSSPSLRIPSPAKRKPRPAYDRETQLPKLIGLWPSELRDMSAAGTLKIAALLRKSLRSERQRGRAGHWSYDLNRHIALAEALKAERARLTALKAAEPARASAGISAGRLRRATLSSHSSSRS
ncbi:MULTISPECIES: DUF6477 family protein [Rhodomicrobium]|uniref:DUF6477 family protein n=1 Tax=Rhodomicrobium vannielii TaxID=1069 RepID=UPI0015959FFF|nr:MULTISPECIES: DUF6477 family protein [Rhodomicrobium]